MDDNKTRKLLRRRKLFRTVFGVFSLSGIMFAFQACYGSPQDMGLDVNITGTVKSSATKAAIAGIRVQDTETGMNTVTGQDGTFQMYCEKLTSYRLVFSDIDGSLNGSYQFRDTTVQLSGDSKAINVQIEMH